MSTIWYLLLLLFIAPVQSNIGRSRHKSLSSKRIKEAALQVSIDGILRDASRISRERVVGTLGHEETREFIVSQFNELIWEVERDTFNESTPYGLKQFTNLIVTSKADKLIEADAGSAPHIIVLAAHYDSKFFEKPRSFKAATDSAVPCAILLNIAKSMSDIFESNAGKRPILKIVFFDGEEAFKEWTAEDSLYGARHLASVWSGKRLASGKTLLDSIETFILIDLWGASRPSFFSFHESTDWLFERLATIERKLKEAKLVDENHIYFSDRKFFNANMQDDHIPFLERGVQILHLLPVPYPKVWHTDDDNMQNVDKRAVLELAMMFQALVTEYFQDLNR